MILTENLSITISNRNKKYFSEKGYIAENGQIIEVKIEDMPINSHSKLKVLCDECKTSESLVSYNNYTKTIKKYKIYRCKTCGIKHRKQTFLKKYGFDNPTKCKKISEKISESYNKKTIDERKAIVEKQKYTTSKKYGVEFVMQSESIKQKSKKTCLEKYGVERYSQTEEYLEKVKNTCLEKYGITNTFQLNKTWFGHKQNKQHQETQLNYQSSYERDFIDRYYKFINITKPKIIEYKINGNRHHYHPDFYLPEHNLIIEIKSTYTMNLELEKNLVKKEASIKKGYNFIFIIDKDYTEFENLIKVYHDVA